MSGAEDTDVTVDLPDELLCHVFSFLSLEDKLQLEAVNHKFQRCVTGELKAKPQPLELDLRDGKAHKLNGYDISEEEFFDALQTLAKKAKFSSIWVHFGFGNEDQCRGRLDRILSLLISEHQSLTKVTSFDINAGSSQTVLETFLDKCHKLSAIKLDFNVRPLNSDLASWPFNNYPLTNTFPLDLGQLLKNRGLAELKIKIFHVDQEILTDAFQMIKPNSLRKLDLSFEDMPQLNVAELVNALGRNGSALEEICFTFRVVRVQFAELLESLDQLPALRKCNIDCYLVSNQQFVPAVTSLFALSHINITVDADDFSFFVNLPGCQIVNMIRQIQKVHPGMVVDFDHRGSLILLLGNASIQKSFLDGEVEHCTFGDDGCVECQLFHPSLLRFLRLRAYRGAIGYGGLHQHIPNWQLDRCRVGQIVDHLNTLKYALPWTALSVESNEDHESVTVNFQSKLGDHQFSITIGCGQCLTNGCMKCLD